MIKSNKSTTIEAAIAQIQDGSTIMVGGFGIPGTPFCLVEELVAQGQKDLTIIKNDANETGMGIDLLLQSGQISNLITSHIGLNPRAVKMMNEGAINVEFASQGILAERIRTKGAGLMGFFTDIGLDTELAKAKSEIVIDGKKGLLELALSADFALVHAEISDEIGNLTYAAVARNFNPLIAMAADVTIVEAESIIPTGEIDPNHIHTPSPFVDQLVVLTELPEVYNVIKRK